MINMADLSVSADYTRYHETCKMQVNPCPLPRLTTCIDLQDSLTVERGRRPGVTFVHKMMQYVPRYAFTFPSRCPSCLLRLTKAKSHILFTDVGLNSRHTIYLNIYQNFLLSAMKMHHYLRQWGYNVKKNTSFLRSMSRRVARGPGYMLMIEFC